MVKHATIAAAFCLSTAAGDLSPTEQAKVLEEVNIQRCTKGYAAIQWGDALQQEAQAFASKTTFPSDHAERDPHVPGFHTVKQLRQSWYSDMPPFPDTHFQGIGDPRQAIERFYNDSAYKELYEAGYVGCGQFTYREDGRHDLYTVVCNYASSGNKDEWVHKEVHPRETQTYDACKQDFDSINQLEAELRASRTRRVTIAYTPENGLAASQQAGGCNVKEYRLLFKGRLALVGFDQDNKMCEGADDFTEHDDQGWEWSRDYGIFTKATDKEGEKSCLKLQNSFAAPPHLGTVNRGTTSCTSKNLVLNETSGWQFTQEGFGHNICMQPVPASSINGKLVVYQEQLLAAAPDEWNKTACSSSWQMRQFDGSNIADQAGSLQSDLPQHNAVQDNNDCKVCRSDIGNFACANTINYGCVLAATSFDCLAMGGEWCQPTGWIEHGECGPQCDGAVDPLQQPGQAGCVQLGGVYKTDATDCARIADGDFQKSECRQQNQYNDQDIADCENLVEQSHKMTANVFDTVAGYVYDKPPHEPYCRLWQCSDLSAENIPHQDGDQAWLIAYKLKKIKSSSILV